MKRYSNTKLKDLLIAYLNIISLTGFYTSRSDLHEEIGKRLGLRMYNEGDRTPLDNILHNLDKEIGYIIGVEYDEKEIREMANKLYNKLQKEINYHVR
jgi:hypothetical protein